MGEREIIRKYERERGRDRYSYRVNERERNIKFKLTPRRQKWRYTESQIEKYDEKKSKREIKSNMSQEGQ